MLSCILPPILLIKLLPWADTNNCLLLLHFKHALMSLRLIKELSWHIHYDKDFYGYLLSTENLWGNHNISSCFFLYISCIADSSNLKATHKIFFNNSCSQYPCMKGAYVWKIEKRFHSLMAEYTNYLSI